MARVKRVKFKDHVNVRPSLGRRAATFAVRTVTVVATLVAVAAAVAFFVETHEVDTTVDGWHHVVTAGAKDTRALVATLKAPDVTAALADPFFAGDAWAEFHTAVAVDDEEQLLAMKAQVASDSQMLLWPHLRQRMLSLADTLTLSMDSDTRTRLYAERAFHTVCSGGDRSKVTPMFAIGPKGIADKVFAVVGAHCAVASR